MPLQAITYLMLAVATVVSKVVVDFMDICAESAHTPSPVKNTSLDSIIFSKQFESENFVLIADNVVAVTRKYLPAPSLIHVSVFTKDA